MSIPMFVKKNTKVKIEVFVYDDDGYVEATHVREDVPEGKNPQSVNFIFRSPNYADSNSMMKQLQASNTNIDVAALQDVAMHGMLLDWDLKDEDGEKITVGRNTIEALQPAIGRAAAAGYLSKIRF